MLNVLFSDTEALGASIVLGGLFAWGLVLFLDFKYKKSRKKPHEEILRFINKRVFGIEFLDGTHSIHSFGYVISQPHKLCLVESINIKLLNTRNKPLILKTAHLLSNITGEKIQGVVDGHPANSLLVANNRCARIYFMFPDLSGHLANNNIRGMSMQEFEKQFSNFDIVIETNRKNFKFQYDVKTTRGWVTNIQMGLMTPPPAEKPNVIPLKA